MWLLKWSVPWEDGCGSDTHYQVYEMKERALAAGVARLKIVFADETSTEHEWNKGVFLHERESGEHWCGGVSLQPVPYFPGIE